MSLFEINNNMRPSTGFALLVGGKEISKRSLDPDEVCAFVEVANAAATMKSVVVIKRRETVVFVFIAARGYCNRHGRGKKDQAGGVSPRDLLEKSAGTFLPAPRLDPTDDQPQRPNDYGVR